MAADPLKEVLLKVVQERREQIEKLSVQLNTTFDPIARSELEAKIEQLQKEQIAAQNALGQTLQPQQPAPAPQPEPVPQPQPVAQVTPTEERRFEQLRAAPEEPQAPKGPSKAALEAQARELQTQLLDASIAVERGGLSPDPKDVEHLKEIREKLQAAMRQLGQSDIRFDVAELPPTPTPSQLAEAENLVRRSALEKRRGNRQLSTDLLRKAAEVAPGALAVQEALGDDLMERNQAKPAAEVYAKALAMSPNHAGLERKYAYAISKIQAPVSFEQAMQMGENPIATADAASVKAAAFFSFIIPGIGQIVLGDYVKGVAYLCSWLIMIFWISVQKKDLQGFIGSLAGKHASYSPLVLIPVVCTLVIAVAAAFTCKGAGANAGSIRKQKGNHPLPPVDLPFE